MAISRTIPGFAIAPPTLPDAPVEYSRDDQQRVRAILRDAIENLARPSKLSKVDIVAGGKVSWDNDDVTIAHAANALAFAGASNGYSFDFAVSPATNDGAALGKAGTAWSDLYLASGGVLDWNNGNFTLTHLNAVGLAVAGGHIYLADTNPTVNNVTGWSLRPNGIIACSADGGPAFEVNRKTSDGGLVNLRQDGTLEGQISVNDTTVTYGPFCGSHWARFADDAYIGILPGTILEAIEGVVRWKFATFEVDDVTVTVAYNGPAQHGDSVELDFEGDTYTALVTDEEPGNTLVKHVRVKVSDTANSSAVYGVFISYGNDDGWNDVHVAALGNYFVRMAAGQTPQIGDLVVSDGTGCGTVQDDGVIRSKTVAKVTNAIPQHFYDDGSYLVPCVLYCG